MSFRRQFTHLCVERLTTTAAVAAPVAAAAADHDDDADGGSGSVAATVPAVPRQLLRVSDHLTTSADIFGLSNLRLSSSAPSSSSAFLHHHDNACPPQSPVCVRQPSPRRPTWRCDAATLPFPVQVRPATKLGILCRMIALLLPYHTLKIFYLP